MANVMRQLARLQRHQRIRRNIHGTAERPRLNVFRSLEHIYAQVIDDDLGNTLVAASTVDPELREQAGWFEQVPAGGPRRAVGGRAGVGQGSEASRFRPRRLPVSWPRQGSGRRRARRRTGVLRRTDARQQATGQ